MLKISKKKYEIKSDLAISVTSMSLCSPENNTPFQSKPQPTTKAKHQSTVGAYLSCPPPMYRPPNYPIQSKHQSTMRMNPYPLVGADLSCPPPMYRPPVKPPIIILYYPH